jgi:hypothetical protein
MKNVNARSISNVFNEVAHAFISTTRFVMRTVGRMSWPALLLSCLMVALIASVLPFALMLFVLFMLVKLVAAAFFVKSHKRPPAHDHTI